MSLLFNRKPIVINADLADRIGLNEAIALQQLNYWIQDSTAGEEHHGRKWVYNTFEEWQRDNFPFWSIDTIKRTFTKLKKLGLVETKQLRKAKHDHTNFYTINYESGLLSDQCNLHQSNGAKSANPSGQKASTHKGNLHQSNGAICTDLHTETTTENTTEIITADENSSPVAGGLPVVLSEQKQQGETETVFQDKCRATWKAYAAAYSIRYGVNPVRNAKVNTQVKQLVQRLGEEAAPVAEFFVTNVNEAFIVRKYHDLGALVAGAETYRTQWATGRTMTSGQARQIDSTQTNANAAEEAIRMFRAQQAKGGEQ